MALMNHRMLAERMTSVAIGKAGPDALQAIAEAYRAFIKEQPGTVEQFLKAYLESIRRLKRDRIFAERVYAKAYRESDARIIKKTIEVYADLLKSVPSVPDQGIDIVIKELAQQRPLPKGFTARPEQFRDNAPLEKLVKEGWVDQLYK
jgi:hypothetical protein